jgi:hypothetical protein
MRMEHIPWVFGLLVAIVGVALIADAWLPDQVFLDRERRRRQRAERHRAGEGLLGLGALCIAAALFGRDTWGYGTMAVMLGTALLVIGAVLNRRFLKELLLFRGAARRAPQPLSEPAEVGHTPPTPPPPAHRNLRIR